MRSYVDLEIMVKSNAYLCARMCMCMCACVYEDLLRASYVCSCVFLMISVARRVC